MNIDELSKTIVYHENLESMFKIIDLKIKNMFFLEGYISKNEKAKIDKNFENMPLTELYEKLINEKSYMYWKFATDIVSNLTLTNASLLLKENLFNDHKKLDEMIFCFIDSYFDKIKEHILNKENGVIKKGSIRFNDGLKRYCKKNFEKMYYDLNTFCIFITLFDLSKYGDGIWETFEKGVFKKYFIDKNFNSEYVKFWSFVLKYQKVPNILMKRFIPNFSKFNEIKLSILYGEYSKEYLSLFEGSKWIKQIKNLEINH